MINIEIKISKNTRMVDLTKACIGNDGENLQSMLVFSFVDEFVEGQARIEYEQNGEKYWQTLDKVDETYQFPIKSLIAKEGTINMQLVISEGIEETDVPIFKSNVFYMNVRNSINANEEPPSGYDEWLDIANTKLNQVDNLDIDVTKIDDVATVTITKKDGTQKSVEIYDGTGGSGGTDNYEDLTNQPSINGVTLLGNKTSNELKIKQDYTADDITFDDGETFQEKYDSGELRGQKGENGTNGLNGLDGENGVTYIPNVSEEGIISWTNDGDLPNPSPINIKGKTGETGEKGQDGYTPVKGVDYFTEDDIESLNIPTKTSDLTNDSGFITSETDPTVPNYVKTITEANITSWNNKQDQLTAGENITIENNVISATTGGGGEVPVYIVTWNDSSSSAKETWTKIYKATLNKEPFAIYLYASNRYIPCTMVIQFPTIGPDFIFSAFTENTGHSYGVSTAQHWKYQLRLTVNDSNEVTNIYYINKLIWEIPREAKALGVSNTTSYTPTADYNPSTKLYTDKTHYENMTGYDASKTQVLKNVQGVLTWIDEI